MHRDFTIRATKIDPTSFLAMNAKAIFERLDSKITMTAIHAEIEELISSSESDQKCSYRTLRRFVSANKSSQQPEALPKNLISSRRESTSSRNDQSKSDRPGFIDVTKRYSEDELV
jgi:hypothetical protein